MIDMSEFMHILLYCIDIRHSLYDMYVIVFQDEALLYLIAPSLLYWLFEQILRGKVLRANDAHYISPRYDSRLNLSKCSYSLSVRLCIDRGICVMR